MSFRPRLEILPPAQRELWPQLKPLVKLGLVLYAMSDRGQSSTPFLLRPRSSPLSRCSAPT